MNTPNRFSETVFRRYAHVIGAALNAYPQAIKVDPWPIRADSYKQPLRDAMEAKSRYGYQHALINNDLFDNYFSLLVVSSDNANLVYIGPRNAVVRKGVIETGTIKGIKDNTAEIEVKIDYLAELCFLIRNKAFTPMPEFVVSIPSPDLATKCEELYHVNLIEHPVVPLLYNIVGPLNIGIGTGDDRL